MYSKIADGLGTLANDSAAMEYIQHTSRTYLQIGGRAEGTQEAVCESPEGDEWHKQPGRVRKMGQASQTTRQVIRPVEGERYVASPLSQGWKFWI